MVKCFIGCLEDEQREEQTVAVNVCLDIEDIDHISDDKLKSVRDYYSISKEIEFILKASRFHLLENATRFLAKYLLLNPTDLGHSKILKSTVEISKFDAIQGDARVAIETTYHHDEISFEREERPWGYVDVIDEIDRLGLYTLNIDPYCELPLHYHEITKESELILSSGLKIQCQDSEFKSVKRGQAFHWEKGQQHGYRNMGSSIGSILCVDEPKYVRTDEIVVNP